MEQQQGGSAVDREEKRWGKNTRNAAVFWISCRGLMEDYEGVVAVVQMGDYKLLDEHLDQLLLRGQGSSS